MNTIPKNQGTHTHTDFSNLDIIMIFLFYVSFYPDVAPQLRTTPDANLWCGWFVKAFHGFKILFQPLFVNLNVSFMSLTPLLVRFKPRA